jgi:D-inositol-3-phosphate glycosyltransferase
MRIALVSEHASPLAEPGGPDHGGQNTHVAALATTLAGAGHEVRVYTRRDSARLPERVSMGERVTVVHVPAGPAIRLAKDDLLPFMGEFGRWLAADWRRGQPRRGRRPASAAWRPDVAHAHFWMSGLAAITARALTGVPVVQTYHALGTVKRRHQGDADTSPPSRIGLERLLGRNVDRVVAQCGDEVRELLAMGVPRAKITVIPSGVDVAHFAPLQTPTGAAEGGEPVPARTQRSRLLVAGRLVERKGLSDVLCALPQVPDAEAVFVGGPASGPVDADPLVRKLLASAEELGVADRVRFPGAMTVEQMPAWYRSADIVVCASWYEPFGLTALEAMGCGVPVVGYAVGGYQDTVVHGVTGQLVRPRDVQALGTALRRLLADPFRRMQYGAAGVDRVRRVYTWARTAALLVGLYEELGGAHQDSGTPAASTSEAS